MYKLSKDYNLLFHFICNGGVAAGFVDYNFSGNPFIHRDICMIKRSKPYDIYIGVRGMSYGTVYPFMENEGEEEDLFIKHCSGCNLEWIEPGVINQSPTVSN
jgi:hypothetical protein